MTARILIATTCRWISAARLAIAFDRAGCRVEAVCPLNHPMRELRAVARAHPFHGLAPLRSLREAIGQSCPDLIVPTDDLAALCLQRLATEGPSSGWMHSLIETSLGPASSYPVLASRERFLAMAANEGIAIPATAVMEREEQVLPWIANHGLPVVFKADGTSGGEGVKIATTVREALHSYRLLRSPLPAAVVAKRTSIDKDFNHLLPWLQRKKRCVTAQSFLRGRDANIAVACWQGEVLASVTAEVVQTVRPKGPAAVIRLVTGGEMLEAARKVAKRLQLSGLCGLDFMIEEATGRPFLIEINARATQTCHLGLGPESGPAARLSAMAVKNSIHQRKEGIQDRVWESVQERPIALFPLAWQIDPSSDSLKNACFDLPDSEPALVRAGLEENRFSSERWVRFSTGLRIAGSRLMPARK